MQQNQFVKDNLRNNARECKFLAEHLNEQDRRLVAGLLALTIGHGGKTCVSEMMGLDRDTIAKGQLELKNRLKDYPEGKQRLPGGGRKSIEKKVPKLSKHLNKSSKKKQEECQQDAENLSD
jgi:hypothetical protein